MTYESSCVSVDDSCSGSGYSITFTNTGDTIVSGGTIEIYFGNGTAVYGQTTCTFDGTILPQYSFDCTGSTPSNVPAYSDVILSILYPDGKTYSFTYTPPSGSTLYSATLYGGLTANSTLAASSYFAISIDNFGAPSYITGVSLYGVSSSWDNNSAATSNSNLIIFQSDHTAACTDCGILKGSSVSSFTFYPVTNGEQISITQGKVYTYVIDLDNGGSVEGSLIAQ